MLLEPLRWAYCGVRLAPRCVGRLRCERAVLQLGDHATLTFKVSTFPLLPPQPTLANLHLHTNSLPFSNMPTVWPGMYQVGGRG